MSWLLYAILGFVAYQLFTARSKSDGKKAAAKKVKSKRDKRPRLSAHPAMSGEDPHRVLGVVADASVDEIRRAHKERVLAYHPDRLATAAPELQVLAEKRTKEINAAFAELMRRRGG